MTVSTIDIEHLKVIRQSVRAHILSAAIEHDASGLTVLDIAPQDHEGAKGCFKKADIKTLDINPGADYQMDICSHNPGIIGDNIFDIIICTEVLEHVFNPFNAVREMERMMKPGGMIYVTTPFNFRIHGPLPDCWRFTIHGLKALFKDFDDVTIEAVESDRFLMPVHYRLTARKHGQTS